jgi:DNA sulfur modification protein DndB
MSEQRVHSRRTLPALRARMGDWIYYITFMKMSEIADRIIRIQPIYESKPLQDLLQRQLLTGHTKEIEHYLLTQKQRFFNALVVGTSGGDPKWLELEVKEMPGKDEGFQRDLEGTLGFLVLDGTERLFTIDGQHRVEGIRAALRGQPKLKDEEVCVVLVKAITSDEREKDPQGFQRTRRLFTVLNRYAKPVGKKDIIALDEDDMIAIITRKLVNEHPLFEGSKISIKSTKGVSDKDKTAVTSIITLYDLLDIFFGGLSRGEKKTWGAFKQYRPTDAKIDEFYEKTTQMLEAYCGYFPALREVRESKPSDEIAAKYRNEDGGHVLFRPVGLLTYGKVVKRLVDSKSITVEKAISQVSKAPVDLSSAPWAGLFWNTVNKKMMTQIENQRVAEKLLFYAVGGDLSSMGSDEEKVRYEWGGILQKDGSEMKLPKYTD